MLKKLYWLPLLLLTACPQMGGPAGGLDGKKFLSGMEGPKVPTVQETLLESAKDAEKDGNFPQAAQIYRQVLDKDPTNKDVLLSLADSTRRSGDNDRAMAMYDSLLQQDAANVPAKEGKALALMSKGDFDTPAVLFQEVMSTDPKRWKTLNGLGILFTTRDMQTEAQQYFSEALKYNPGSASVTNNMGLSQALQRHYDVAIGTLSQAANLTANGSPEHKRVDLNLALVYAAAGQMDAAQDIAARYFSGPTLNNNMGLYAHLAKDDQLAKTYLNMALTESKTFYARAWDNLQGLSAPGNTPTAVDAAITDVFEPAAEQPQKKTSKKKKKKASGN